MEKIPSLIPTITFIGKMNAGKSTIINNITNQDISIVSEIAGTTTDEVVKRFELLGVGPINLIDTAGINDRSLHQQPSENRKQHPSNKRTRCFL